MTKKICSLLLVILMVMSLTVGCLPENSTDVLTISEEYTITYPDDAHYHIEEAALSLQAALEQKAHLTLDFTDVGSSSAKQIILRENTEALTQGQYRTQLDGETVIIEAYDPQTMALAMRQIRYVWLNSSEGLEEGTALTISPQLCQTLSGAVSTEQLPHFVMTQNIRGYDDAPHNTIAKRAPRFEKLVNEYRPDILCIQESTLRWLQQYETLFSDTYSWVGAFNGGPGTITGTQNCILYRTDRYELLEWENFWMSYTPEVPSKVEQSNHIRCCTWALLKDKSSGEELLIINVHLDNGVEVAISQQLAITFERMEEKMAQYPTILAGDFNCSPATQVVYPQACSKLNDSRLSANLDSSTINITCDQYGTRETPRIFDYIFHNNMLTVEEYRILNEQYGGYVSDHYAVFTEVYVKDYEPGE